GLTQPLLLWLTYRVRRMREFACGCACMFFLAILYGGFFSFLQGKIGWVQDHALAMPVIAGSGAALYEALCALVKRLQSHTRVRQAEDSRRYEVHFRIDGFRIDCIGMLDTGNRLYEPIRGVPAAVLEGALYPESERGLPKAVIPFHSLGCQNGLLYGYAAQDVVLAPVGEEVSARSMDGMLVALYDGRLSAEGGYQMLLHPDFFLETALEESQMKSPFPS
ncbi:MAG: sigma-E processing peptidase SpoIIGA, partial [bacterium]|nr:sigma-E processing peptidase SpoIIGA [bacterium]